MKRKSLVAAALGAAVACLVPAASADEGHVAGLASLEMHKQTMVALESSAPLDAAALVGTDGKPASAQLLRGHWTLLYFGFTSCSLEGGKSRPVARRSQRQCLPAASAGFL